MKKTLAISLLAGALGALSATSAQAIDTKARFMAANCAYCHGPEGKSRGAIPSLAGLEKIFCRSDESLPRWLPSRHSHAETRHGLHRR
jgi:cytochrome c553